MSGEGLGPWTEREFIAALRGAGWRRVRGPARIYRSPDWVEFHLDECHAGTGVRWRYWAGRRELPSGRPEWQERLREQMRERMRDEGEG